MSDVEIEVIANDENSLNQSLLSLNESINEQTSNKLKTNRLKENRFSPITRKMSNPENLGAGIPAANLITNSQEIQLLMNAIPEYHPGQNLSIFINEVDNLLRHLQNRLSPDLVYVVGFNIRSKIKGEARDFIAYQNATDWPEIRAALLQKYGDQRSEELLESALRHCVQLKKESYMDYYSRLLKAFNDLVQHITLNINDANYLHFKKIEYEKLALKTFQIGIIEPYRSYLSNFTLTTIEECLNKCTFFDNRKQEWEYCEFLRKSNDPNNKPHNFSTKPHFSNQPPRTYPNTQVRPSFQPQNSTNNFRNPNFITNNNSFQRNFPPKQFSGDINKPLPQSNRLPTNRQVFGTKPASNFSRLQNRDTPMSVQSRFSAQQKPHSSFQRPPVIVEELYNIETHDEPVQNPDNEIDFCPLDESQAYSNTNEYNEDDENFTMHASEQ